VLHTESTEDVDRSIVHADGDGEVVLAHRVAKQFTGCRGQIEVRRDSVKLALSGLEGAEGCSGHVDFSPEKEEVRCLMASLL
jgi:hypothetical protein